MKGCRIPLSIRMSDMNNVDRADLSLMGGWNSDRGAAHVLGIFFEQPAKLK